MPPRSDTTEPPPPTTTWPTWFNRALRERAMTQADFNTYNIASPSTVSRWTVDGVPKSADLVIETAHLLAPEQVADALEAAGYHLTATYVRGNHVAADHDPMIARIRRESTLNPDERARMEYDYLRRRDENARLLEADLADAVRRRRQARGTDSPHDPDIRQQA
jgi:hypothetical protein